MLRVRKHLMIWMIDEHGFWSTKEAVVCLCFLSVYARLLHCHCQHHRFCVLLIDDVSIDRGRRSENAIPLHHRCSRLVPCWFVAIVKNVKHVTRQWTKHLIRQNGDHPRHCYCSMRWNRVTISFSYLIVVRRSTNS